MLSNALALNRLFNKNVFHELINGKSNKVFKMCLNQYVDNTIAKSNYEVIGYLYKYLSKNHRNEYFYKNTLLNKLLLGKHSINTTTALTELPINNSKADFVLINGHATVYEIKTELDTFDRLESQLQDYYTAFNKVYVLTSEDSVEKLKVILEDTNVGINVLTRRNTISNRKQATEDNRYLNHNSLFKLLRKKEYETILLKHFGYLPNTTQVKYYQASLNLFKDIPLIKAYQYMLKELKKRNIKEKEEFMKVPYELKFLSYFSGFKPNEYARLQRFLNKTRGSY